MHEDEPDEALAPANIVDKVVFGRRLRAARVMHGYDRMADFAADIRRRYGVEVSDRTVYAIERGEQMPHLDFFIAAMAALQTPYNYFWPAIRREVVDELRQLGTA